VPQNAIRITTQLAKPVNIKTVSSMTESTPARIAKACAQIGFLSPYGSKAATAAPRVMRRESFLGFRFEAAGGPLCREVKPLVGVRAQNANIWGRFF
jgi:hypothetical protein